MIASDQLKIDTPEQVALDLPIAGIGSRFLALTIDTVVQFVIFVSGFIFLFWIPLALIPSAIFGRFGGSVIGPALLILLIFCIYWGYFACFEIFLRGQTPGKRAAGIRVIKDSGRPLDPLSAILRNLLRAIDLLPGMYAVGVVCMILDRHSRRLGDLVAGTVVVHDRGLADQFMRWDLTSPRDRPSTEFPASALPNDAEVVVIEAYLGRRLELGPEAQDRIAGQIADRLKVRLELQPLPGQTVDEFLEAVVRQVRDSARFR